MRLVIARGPFVRPSDEHSFVVPLVSGDLMNDAGIASHSGQRHLVRRLVAVTDVLNDHITDFRGALFSVAARPHNYIIPKGLGEVKNYL